MNIRNILASVTIALLSSSAFALSTLQGDFTYNGFGATDTSSAATVTTFTYAAPLAVLGFGTGDLAGFTTISHMSPLSIPAVNATFDFGALTNLWTNNSDATNYFQIQSYTRGTGDADTVILQGEGLMSKGGFLDTVYSWSFSFDTATSLIASFSATQVAVPEPGTLALLGLGLAGLGAARRKQKAA